MPGFTVNNGEVTKLGLWPGTVIKLSNGQRFKVTKLNPVNIKMLGEDGKNYTFNRDHAERFIDENQEWNGPKEKTEYDLYLERQAAGLVLGSTVKLTKASLLKKYGADTVWVVIALPNDGTYRLTKLGGWGNQYLRKITPGMVEVVEL